MTQHQSEIKEPTIYLIAGEPSGDALGASLMNSLNIQFGGKVRFCGVGGDKMTKEGLRSLFPMKDITLMGFIEILPHIPRILMKIRMVIRDIKKKRPDCLVTIDSPEFNFRVGRVIKRKVNIPIIHYVAPSVWAYRPNRARKISKFLDHILVLFPFEPPYFVDVGIPTTFVGHPLCEKIKSFEQRDHKNFITSIKADNDDIFISVLPGSRVGEINKHIELFRKVIEKLSLKYPKLKVLMPVAEGLEDEIKSLIISWPVPVHLIIGENDKYTAFHSSKVALAVSGTVTLELGLCNVSMVVAYRANFISAAIAKKIVNIENISLSNIIIGQAIAPEFLQEDANVYNISKAIEKLLDSELERENQLKHWRLLRRKLTAGDEPASKYATNAILRLIN